MTKKGISADIIHNMGGRTVKLEKGKFKINTKKGRPENIAYGGGLKNKKHLHTFIDGEGRLKTIITDEKKRGTETEHILLTKNNFEELNE